MTVGQHWWLLGALVSLSWDTLQRSELDTFHILMHSIVPKPVTLAGCLFAVYRLHTFTK